MSLHCSEHDLPGDTNPPQTNISAGVTANFTTMLELFCAQRDSQVLAQAVSPPLTISYSALPTQQ
jgi:hypothetical protein